MPTFQYYGGGLPQYGQQQQIDYSPPPQQQQQSPLGGGGGLGGIGGLASMFGGGGGAATGTATGATATTGGTSAAGGGAGAAGGGGSAGGGGAAAGWWAALAAIIIANESEAQRGGYRSEDEGDYAKDVLGGKVLEQDVENRWLPMIFGEDDEGNLRNDFTGLGGDTKAGAEIASLNFDNAWKSFKEEGVLSKILDVF